METVQRFVQEPITIIKESLSMAPSADTSFAAHVKNQFTSYEADREAASQEVIYATR